MAKKKEEADKKVPIKDEDAPKNKTNTLDIAKKSIIKKYGKGVISYLGNHDDLVIDAISTGSVKLDSALGTGGFARGRLYEIFGPNSSGKSTLAISVMLQALLREMTCAYVDAEHSIDPKLLRNMGKEISVNTDGVELVQGYTGDDNLEIGEILMQSGELDLLIVDSVSSLLPKDMSEGDIGDNYIGLLARLMSKACLKLTPVANRTNTLLIFINQIRHSIGKWGDDRVTTGGEALGFYSTGRVKVEGGEARTSRLLDKDGVVEGHVCSFEVIKNKLAVPWRKAEVNLIYGKGYDFVGEMVDLAVDFSIIEKSGAWYEYKGTKVQGKEKMVVFFRDKDNKDAYDDITHGVKELLGLK